MLALACPFYVFVRVEAGEMFAYDFLCLVALDEFRSFIPTHDMPITIKHKDRVILNTFRSASVSVPRSRAAPHRPACAQLCLSAVLVFRRTDHRERQAGWICATSEFSPIGRKIRNSEWSGVVWKRFAESFQSRRQIFPDE